MLKLRLMVLKQEVFKYATPLYFNMGYYNIILGKDSNSMCTILLPWGEYMYKCLPMGVSNSLDILQEKMNKMFYIFEFIQSYINNLLIITKGGWSNHLEKLELASIKIK